MRYLSVEELLAITASVTGRQAQVRDLALLDSAAHRPQTAVFGHEPYPTVADKAAALLVALARNHALVDGNKRLALAACLVFCRWNSTMPYWSNDQAYKITIGAATGQLNEKDVADLLRQAGT